MKKIYERATFGTGFIEHVIPAWRAPFFRQAPMQNHPKQSVTAVPVARQQFDYSQFGPVLDLVRQQHQLATVREIPVRQPAVILRAARAAVGPARTDVPDQRLGILDYPAKIRPSDGPLEAPPRLQSVPGYIVQQSNLPSKASVTAGKSYKAPRARTAGGVCDD